MFIQGFCSNLVNNDSEFLPLIESEENYKLNLLSQPSDWEYRTKQIRYKYNSLGHRSCELHELPKDYLLFAGCSFTEGIGLKLEDTYSHIVSQQLGLGYYNLGLGGSCPSVSVKNIITFLSKFIHNMPKTIIVQWPYFLRYYKINPALWIEHHTPAGAEDTIYKALLENEDAYRYNIWERLYLLHFLHNIKYTGKVIELYTQNLEETNYIRGHDHTSNFTNIRWTRISSFVDYARDLSHPGSLTNKSFADKILKILNMPLT